MRPGTPNPLEGVRTLSLVPRPNQRQRHATAHPSALWAALGQDFNAA